MPIKTFQGKIDGDECFCLVSTLNSGGIAMASVHLPFDNWFFVCYSLMGLMDASPTAFRAWYLGEPVPLVGVLKYWVLDVGFKPFAPWGEVESWVPAYMSLYWVVYGICLSFAFHVSGCFLIHPVCRSHSSSFCIPFRENRSQCNCPLGVSVGEGCSGLPEPSGSCHLVNSSKLQFIHFIYFLSSLILKDFIVYSII